jgi:diaminopimelate decarboxylase
MVDEAVSLITTVCTTKRLNNGKRGLVIDAGVNLLPSSYWYDYEIVPAIDRGFPSEDHTLYGPLCMQIDCVRDHIRLPHLEKGDPIVFRSVGAYNLTQWLQFITLRPNVVMISERGEVAVIREAETLEYLQQGEKFPEWQMN